MHKTKAEHLSAFFVIVVKYGENFGRMLNFGHEQLHFCELER